MASPAPDTKTAQANNTPGMIPTARVEAFSDGVIAILITIMVFDIKVPDFRHELTHHEALRTIYHVLPKFGAFLASFLVLGIMWVNHHHMFHLVQRVDTKLLWLNMHLLFWMALVPFPTSMLGANPELPDAAALYGGVLTMTAVAFTLMRRYAVTSGAMRQTTEALTKEVKRVNRRVLTKNLVGIAAYLASVPLAFVSVYASFACFLIPLILFFMPDKVDVEKLPIGGSARAGSGPAEA
jgi:uncharacterized membrane protein